MNIRIGLLAGIAVLTACHTEKEFDATGVFEATEIIVSAEGNGKILSLDVEEGSRLEAREEVGVIDTLQLFLKKCQLEASMKSVGHQRPDISKQIAATQAQIATAERERNRVERLLEAQAANQKQLDDWDSQLSVLHKQLEAQLSSLSHTTSSLTAQESSIAIQITQTDDLLKKCHITAPIDGTVLTKYTEAGELASVGKPLFKIADTEHLYLRAYVTSLQLSEIQLGKTVKVYADFGDKQLAEFPGVVSWIADQAEFTPKTILTDDERANLVYAVKIALTNDGTIKLGMYGKVKF